MQTNIQIFTNDIFGEIRTCLVNNQIMFVGKDVATALGYKNPSNALQVHVDSEDKTSYLIQVSGSNYKANTLFVNESGLYSLVLSSKLPQAKAFKRWVTCEVLPQIRMTGGYIPTKDAYGRVLSEEEIVERAHEIVGRTLQLLNSKSEYCLTATQVAASWGMDVLSFNNLLAGMGIQQRKGGRWQLSDELQGRGLTETRSFFCYSLKGKARMKRYLVWTQEGIDFLNMAVRKMPREVKANVQLNFNF
jgi:prophage antirepressor-like protein